MENKGKCYRCRHMDRYYTKEEKQFCKTQFGWCRKRQETIRICEACEEFSCKPVRKNKVNGFLAYYLDGLLTQISQIRAILEEKDEEEKNDES